MTLAPNTTSARKIAYEIANGMRPLQHIGFKSKEILKQELFSLKNSYTPETMTAFEKSEFEKEINKVVEGILQLPKDERPAIYDQVDEMLNP